MSYAAMCCAAMCCALYLLNGIYLTENNVSKPLVNVSCRH